jgi:hypothetical protein
MPSQVSYTINFVVGGNTTETVVIKYKANNETTYTVATTITVPPGVPQSYTLGPFDSHIVYDVILETECDGGGTEFGGIRYLANFICSPFTLEFVGSDLSVEWECFVDETTGDSVKEYRIDYRLLGSTGAFTSVTFPISTITSYWAANPGSYPFYTGLLTTGVNPALSYEVNHYTIIEYNYYNVDPPITIEVIINESLPCDDSIPGVECDTCEAIGFDTNPGVAGVYVDNDSTLLVNFNGGTFDNYFLKVGEASTADGIGSSITFLYRMMVYIDNPSSVYFGMIAIKSVSWNAGFFSKVQIWDPATDPTTPTFVTEFTYGRSGFGTDLFGTMAYDAVDDALYLTSRDFRLVKLNLATGVFTDYPASAFSYPLPWSVNPIPTPSGDVDFRSVIINPVTRRRYIYTNGVLLFPPNGGTLGILAPDNDTVERIFPHDSVTPFLPGSLAYPANLRTEIAVSSGIAFDLAGNAYMLSRTNASDYSVAQNDIVILDGVTHNYIGTINYDITQTWLPYSNNNYTWNHISHYDGSGFIPGEKILVLYRNYGPASPLVPNPGGNSWTTAFPGTSARLVAFDTITNVASVIIEIPDTAFGGAIDAFVYSYKYNKIFFSVQNFFNKVIAYDGANVTVYNENLWPGGAGVTAFTYQGVEAFDCGRIVYINGSMNPAVNMYVIGPAAVCSEGTVDYNLGPYGPYSFDDTTNSWSPLSTTVVNPGLTSFTVTSTFDPSIVDAVLLVSTDGGTTYIPYEDQSSALYAIPAAWSAGRTYDYPPGYLPPTVLQFSVKVQFNDGTCSYMGPDFDIPCTGAISGPPIGPIVGAVTGVCGASNVNYALGTSDANFYSWDIPLGVTISGASNLNSVNLNFPSTGFFTSGTITVTAYYCYGETQTSSITVEGRPDVPVIVPGAITPGTSELYIASSSGATSYNWTITGDIISDFCTDPTTCSQWFVDWGPLGGQITVTAENSCGVSDPITIDNL